MASSAELQPADFASYPPQARQFAGDHIATLRSLPVILTALLLERISNYDWLFPAERAELEEQMLRLQNTNAGPVHVALQEFAALPLSPELLRFPWAQQPVAFSEKLTAYLWTSHAIDAFRAAATNYQQALNTVQTSSTPAAPRLCIVLVGRGAQPGRTALFEKLRPHGTYFSLVEPQDGLQQALSAVQAEAKAYPAAYGHWYVDGGVPENTSGFDAESGGTVTLSYAGLAGLRGSVLKSMEAVRASGTVGPEGTRSMLAQLRPEQFGSAQVFQDEVMRHFTLSLFTEGSGTQIFSTTFVQWTGREILRRARPQTLLLRYAPRQAERPMNDLLHADLSREEQPDPQGSLIDANMGAYYTWINLMRLPGAERARFLAWFEGQEEAVAIAPGMAKATASSQSCTVKEILHWMS